MTDPPRTLRSDLALLGGMHLAGAWGLDAARLAQPPSDFVWRRDGTLVVLAEDTLRERELRVAPAVGRVWSDPLSGEVGDVALSDDGMTCFCSGARHLVEIDLATRTRLREGRSLPPETSPRAVAPDGSRLVYREMRAFEDAYAWRVRSFSGEEDVAVEGWDARHDDLVAFRPDGAQVLLIGPGRLARVDASTGRLLATRAVGGDRPRRVERVSDDAVDVLFEDLGLIRWWLDGDRLEVLVPAPEGERLTAARRLGDRVVTVAGGVARWFERGAPVCERRFETPGVRVTISPDLRFVVDLSPPVVVWYAADEAGARGGDDSPLGRVEALALRDDATAVAAGSGVDVAVWSVTSGALLWRFECPHGVSDLRFHPSGASLFACDRAGAVFEWDLASGRERARHPTPVQGEPARWRLAVAPHGDRVVRWCPTGAGRKGEVEEANAGAVATVRADGAAFDAQGAMVVVEHARRDAELVERVLRVAAGRGAEVVSERVLRADATRVEPSLSDDGRWLVGGASPETETADEMGLMVVDVASGAPGRAIEVPAMMGYAVAGSRCATVVDAAWGVVERRPHALSSGSWRRLDIGGLVGGDIAALVVSRCDRVVAVGLTTGTVLVYLEADFADALDALPRGADVGAWAAVLSASRRVEALALARALLVGYLHGRLTADRWQSLVGSPPATPWEIDEAVKRLWDALVAVGIAAAWIEEFAGGGLGELRRWAWQPRWDRALGGDDDLTFMGERGVDAILDVLGDPGLPRRDRLLKIVDHTARDQCYACLGDPAEFARVCGLAGTWARAIRAVVPAADVAYLERLARYAAPRRVTAGEVEQLFRDVCRCRDPGDGAIAVDEVEGGWVAILPAAPDEVEVRVDAATGALRVALGARSGGLTG